MNRTSRQLALALITVVSTLAFAAGAHAADCASAKPNAQNQAQQTPAPASVNQAVPYIGTF